MCIKLGLLKPVQLVQICWHVDLDVEKVFVRSTLNLAHESENLLFKCNDLLTLS